MRDLVVSLASLLGFDGSEERHLRAILLILLGVNMDNIFTYRLFLGKEEGVCWPVGLSMTSWTRYRKDKGLLLKMIVD